MTNKSVLKVGVIGAGFSGVALTATLHRLSKMPVEITLFEKTGNFGVGDAYRTPFSFHLLNVRAKDMSAFVDDPSNFVAWLEKSQDEHSLAKPLAEQYVPRLLFRQYLKSLLDDIQSDKNSKIKLTLEPFAVTEVTPVENEVVLTTNDGRQIKVDKVVLALGNNPPNALPFPVSEDVQCITNPWDYKAPANLNKQDPVLIVGTGLSMIDTVLTLHYHKHQGKIYAVSRHGLMPLAHADHSDSTPVPGPLPKELRALTKYLRLKIKQHGDEGGDWRAVITGIRSEIPQFWASMSLRDKKRFLRHLLPYWNIHRHRVHWVIAELLDELSAKNQLTILAGRIVNVENGKANIKLRHSGEILSVEVKHVINCMGPSLIMSASDQPLVHSLFQQGIATLDPLKLGFAVSAHGALKDVSGTPSKHFYTLGSTRKGEVWEINAVPDLRVQSFNLARYLLGIA